VLSTTPQRIESPNIEMLRMRGIFGPFLPAKTGILSLSLNEYSLVLFLLYTLPAKNARY
jgi:hypothetical protein